MSDPLIFFIPRYLEGSAGIVCCHRLADELAGRGYWVRVMQYDDFGARKAEGMRYELLGTMEKDLIKDAIIFYPEVVIGNPLERYGARKIVRLILNRDGLLSGGKVERMSDEFIVSYSNIFELGDYLMRSYYFDQDVFNLEGAKSLETRNVSVVYQGKGRDFIAPEGIKPPLVMLTRGWMEWERLAELLKESKALYSSDCFTFLLHEALLCGCAPVITDFKDWDLKTLLHYELPQVYELNESGDFSPENILNKRKELVKSLNNFKTNYSHYVDEMMSKIESHFSKRLVVA